MKRVDEGRRWFADLPAVTEEQRVQVRQAEASMLREAGDEAAAYAVLANGSKEHPDSTELLYDLAMAAEKLGKVDEAERHLKHVVELKPDDPQAPTRIVVVMPPGLVDRSPCGTGTTAKVATLLTQGRLGFGEAFTHQSVTGATFIGRAVEVSPLGSVPAWRVAITGRSYLIADATIYVDRRDELEGATRAFPAGSAEIPCAAR